MRIEHGDEVVAVSDHALRVLETASFLDDERVRPQAGTFYAGWITDEIEGPFKGEPGTEGW